jgi:predicted phosphoadenosine phosphosulfate sulfurtransferase
MHKVRVYEKTWERRCYSRGIPDEVPAKIAKAMRAPSYKAIAMCILKNDLHLTALGFSPKDTSLVDSLRKVQNGLQEHV